MSPITPNILPRSLIFNVKESVLLIRRKKSEPAAQQTSVTPISEK